MVSKIDLFFVYNLNSNPISQAVDFFQLIRSPQTFKCNLYKITHDSFFMKKEWETFVKESLIRIIYLYKDEFNKKYPDSQSSFPVILINDEGKITTFISSDEVNGMLSYNDLIKTITKK